MTGSLINHDVTVFLLWAAALIIGITVHEYAHAAAAEHLGDPTPRLQGRLTLNPLAHLDPLGTLMLLLAHFGWGKPVVFDPFNLRNPRRDGAIISLAGPVTNIVVATLAAVAFQLLLSGQVAFMALPTLVEPVKLLASFCTKLVEMNVVLAVFNLVPIHPLDGFKIVGGILPEASAREWAQLEPYGMIFLLLLIFPLFGGVSPISRLISPVINFLLALLLPGAAII